MTVKWKTRMKRAVRTMTNPKTFTGSFSSLTESSVIRDYVHPKVCAIPPAQVSPCKQANTDLLFKCCFFIVYIKMVSFFFAAFTDDDITDDIACVVKTGYWK